MRVPLLDLQAQYQSLKPELDAALLRVAESQACILGPEVETFERAIADYLRVDHAIAVSSGTDALLMALMLLEIQRGDEVIVPTFSFFATAGTVIRAGGTPVFVDSKNDSLNIDPDLIRRAITPKTKAIIPVHLYGLCADMDEILAIGLEHSIPVIEDAAQAIGTDYRDGRRAGSMGVVGCFSFYPTKNLGAFGDAGLITTMDANFATKLKQMRNHGMEPRYFHKFVGGNFRMDGIQAAVLSAKLPHLESWHEKRRENAAAYRELFIKHGLSIEGDFSISLDNQIVLPFQLNAPVNQLNLHIYHQFVIRLHHRDEIRSMLAADGIGSEIYYPVPFHRQECFSFLKCNDGDFPVANAAAETCLALPIYPEMSHEQIEFVVETLAKSVRSRGNK